MQMVYNDHKIKELCTNYSLAVKKLGKERAIKLKLRLNQISAANSVEALVINHIGGCHALSGDRVGQYAMHLTEPYRLIFKILGNEIEIVNIIEVVDYHKR